MTLAQSFQSNPGMWTIHQQDQLVYIDPPPNQVYVSEWDVISIASPLVNLTDIDTQIPDPWAQAVQYKAAYYLLLKHQNFGQAHYYENEYMKCVPRIITGSGGYRVPNPYNRSAIEKMRRA